MWVYILCDCEFHCSGELYKVTHYVTDMRRQLFLVTSRLRIKSPLRGTLPTHTQAKHRANSIYFQTAKMSFKVAVLGKFLSLQLCYIHSIAHLSPRVLWLELTLRFFSVADPSSAAGFWGGEYGIQVYDLSADQICSILQSPEHSNGS